MGGGVKFISQIKNANKTFALESAMVAAIRALGLLCVFVLHILIARFLDDSAEFGKYAWGQNIFFVVGTICALGLPAATSRYVAALNATAHYALSREIVALGLKYLVLSTLTIITVVLFIIFAIPAWSNPAIPYRVTLAALLFAPLFSFLSFYQNQALVRRWMVLAFFPMHIIRPVVTGLLVFICWKLSLTPPSALLVIMLFSCSIAAALIPQVLLYRQRERKYKDSKEGAPPKKGYEPESLWRYAMSILRSRIAITIIEYSSVLVLTLLAGPAATGTFFAAERLARLCGLPREISVPVGRPRIVATHAVNDTAGLQHSALQVAHSSFWPSLLAIIALSVAGETLLGLFGENYKGATYLLYALLLGYFIRACFGSVDDLLMMTGHQELYSRVVIVSALTHVLLLFLLIPLWGAMGAAIAIIISSTSRQLSLFFLVKRLLGVNATILGRGRLFPQREL